MKKALILHAYQNTPDGNWYPWLRQELEKKGYEVWIPILPTMDSDYPDLDVMLRTILDKNFVDQETIVVGHSLGALVAMRLAEKVGFRMGVVIAGWDFNDLDSRDRLFWKDNMNHTLMRSNVPTWIIPISDNDPYVSAYMTERMAERLGGTKLMLGKKGHFTLHDGVVEIPEILKYV